MNVSEKFLYLSSVLPSIIYAKLQSKMIWHKIERPRAKECHEVQSRHYVSCRHRFSRALFQSMTLAYSLTRAEQIRCFEELYTVLSCSCKLLHKSCVCVVKLKFRELSALVQCGFPMKIKFVNHAFRYN